jgi:hypothetical protein
MKQTTLNKSSKDKFLMVLSLPPLLKTINNKNNTSNSEVDLDTLQSTVYGSITPDLSIPNTYLPYATQGINITSGKRDEFTPLSLNFKIDNRWFNYWVIYQWMMILNDDKTGDFNKSGLSSPGNSSKALFDYSTTMTLYGLDEYENKIIKFDYIGVFPVFLRGVDWEHRSDEEIDCSVKFAFSQMIPTLL